MGRDRYPELTGALRLLSGEPEIDLLREYKFDEREGKESRQFRFDYAWPQKRIALEVEGGIWRKGGGAHSHPTGIIRDIEKYNLAMMQGWRVIRLASGDPGKFPPAELEWLERELR